MFQIVRSTDFDTWLRSLRDAQGKARILARLRSAALGNFGDAKPVGSRVFEMRVHTGPGYRIYYMRSGASIYVLLTGGDKSGQEKDIARAHRLAREWEEEAE